MNPNDPLVMMDVGRATLVEQFVWIQDSDFPWISISRFWTDLWRCNKSAGPFLIGMIGNRGW